MATLTVMLPQVEPEPEAPTAPLGLYEVDGDLAALVDTEASVPEEQRAAFVQSFQMAIRTSPDKVAQALAFFESQIELAKSEIRRIRQRQADMEFFHESLSMHAISAIKALGPDRKGKYSKIEGQACTLGIRANPESIEITDAAAIPDSCKAIAPKLPLDTWNAVLDSVDLELAQKLDELAGRAPIEVSKSAVKTLMSGAAVIPGAKTVQNYRLEVK